MQDFIAAREARQCMPGCACRYCSIRSDAAADGSRVGNEEAIPQMDGAMHEENESESGGDEGEGGSHRVLERPGSPTADRMQDTANASRLGIGSSGSDSGGSGHVNENGAEKACGADAVMNLDGGADGSVAAAAAAHGEVEAASTDSMDDDDVEVGGEETEPIGMDEQNYVFDCDKKGKWLVDATEKGNVSASAFPLSPSCVRMRVHCERLPSQSFFVCECARPAGADRRLYMYMYMYMHMYMYM